MKYALLFTLIQLANLVLMPVGWIVCLPHFPTPWLWENEDDAPLIAGMSPWRRYVYTAWRNPVSNLRHVHGVSATGRPLWRKTWGAKPGGWYAMAGWNNSGYPVLSGGRNVNAY